MPDPLDRVRTAAAARGLDIELRERPSASSLDEAAALLGLQPADIVKTLVVKRSDDSYLFALIPGDRAISWPKLRALLGVNRLSRPDADEAKRVTGFARGTITPFGTLTPLPVVADERIAGRRVSIGAGEHGVAATLDGDDLLAHLGAQVADVTEAEA